MKKIFIECGFAFVLTFFYGVVWGQANPDSQLKYIDVIPPSPGVAKIADYSRPDVGLNSGTAQFHLPITSLSIGTINIPVGLNYSSNGVKVDALSSRVGVDFQLEAGGAITRTVKGNGPDELSTMLNPPLNYVPTSRQFITYMQNVTSGNPWGVGRYDSEPDFFSFSFCGTGGKFVLDSAKKIYQISKTNNKIVQNVFGNNWNFKITDPNGNDYYFGGTGYVETSKRNVTCSHPSTTAIIPTAWFLKKIILYTGDSVNFNYSPVSYSYDMGVTQTMYYQDHAQSQKLTDTDCTMCPVNNDSRCVSYIDVNTFYLTSIVTSRQEAINFGYQSRNDCGDVLLTSVTKSFNGTVTESYQINYNRYNTSSFSDSSLPLLAGTNINDRYFLSSVTQLFNGIYINRYVLSYNDPGSLPVRLSNAQDHWGYFNGRNNSTLIPTPSTLDLINQFPNATANREVDTVNCKKGLLTKIQYMTGGYDSITYQSNTVYMTKTINPTTPAYVSGTVNGGTGFSAVTQTIGTFNVEFAQTVSITLNSKNNGASGADFHYGSTYSLSGPTPDTQGLPTGTDSTPNDNTYIGDAGTTATLGKQIVLQPGWYTLTLTATGNLTQAYVSVTYVPGHPTDVTQNWLVGGVRVGQIVTKSYDGKFIGKKKYTYSLAGSTNSSGVMNYNINYVRPYSFNNYCLEGSEDAHILVSRTCSYISMLSSAIGTLFNPSGNSVSYGFVSETTDDAGANGLVEHTFMTVSDRTGGLLLGSTLLGSTPSNYSALNNGKETLTSYYKKNGTSYQLVQKNTNYYNYGSGLFDILVGVIVNRLSFSDQQYVGSGSVVGSNEIDSFEATDYFVYSPWNTLDSTKAENFSSSGAVYSTVTKYHYDNTTLLPGSISSFDSRGLSHITNNYYSGMSSIPGATSDQTTLFTSMIGRNKIAQLVYQQKTVNNNQVDAHRVIMAQANSSAPVLPQEVRETATTGTEETLFIITKYDASANILERKNRDGVVHSFIWNYFNDYLIAETVGSTYANMDATSFEGNSLGSWNIGTNVITTPQSIAGHQSLALTSGVSVTHAGLTSTTTYIVSFWALNGSGITVNGSAPVAGVTRRGWVYNEATVTGASNLTILGTGNIDELRFYPKGAQMTTYTYDPEIGMTSATDANNVITYYEYDKLKRLVRVRDDQNKILRTNKYQFFDPTKPQTPSN